MSETQTTDTASDPTDPTDDDASVFIRAFVLLARIVQFGFAGLAVIFVVGGLTMPMYQFLVLVVVAVMLFLFVLVLQALVVKPLKGWA